MTLPDNKCQRCVHHTPTALFELCEHPKSKYRVGDKDDFHTITHMRSRLCGPAAELFQAVGGAK